MLNIINHQENANENHSEISSVLEWLLTKRYKTASVSKNMEKREPLCNVVWELVHPLWQTAWSFLKKLKIELPYESTIPLLGIFPKKIKTLTHKDICTPMFTTSLLTTVKVQKQISILDFFFFWLCRLPASNISVTFLQQSYL